MENKKRGKEGKKAITRSELSEHNVPLREKYIKMFQTLRSSATKQRKGKEKKEERGKDPAQNAACRIAFVDSI